ncbi:MAG: hypothetical protein KY461_01195 [Actinobacteria bacterium]|nr:hypothetical protein [Actinomycetota bacterium]
MDPTAAPLPRRRPPGARADLVVLLAIEAGCVLVAVGLGRDPAYRLGWSDPAVWLATSPASATAVALLRPVALVLAGYLPAVTLSYAGVLLLGAPRAAAGLAAVTPAGVRRVAERAVAATLLTAILAAPAGAHAPGADPLLPPGLRGPTAGDHHVPVPQPPRPPSRTVTVAEGDHLWLIAARALAAARGVPVDALPSHDLARYWADTVAVNRSTVRSGDPDLVFPGEVVRLPPIPAS